MANAAVFGTLAQGLAPARIPEREQGSGPLTRLRLRRTLLVYLGFVIAGLWLGLTRDGGLQAFGLGLLLPGGGFAVGLASGWMALAYGFALLLSLLLFAVALFAWFGSGNVLAPPLLWLGSAGLAAATAPAQSWNGAAPMLALLLMGFAAFAWRQQRRALAQAGADRTRRNTHLAELRAVSWSDETQELTPEALGLARHVLDRALQPVESFVGIDWVDQFQFGSLRYALCGMGYALADLHYSSQPAFRGYLSEAQRRLHAKMLNHRNWKYWALENAWGNLSLDANPIHHRDNVMYHGWFAAMLGEYISNTGDTRYNDRPMVLRHPDGREWRYTFSQIVEVLHGSHRQSPFTLFPCEPNWIYPMCNNFSAIGLLIHDRLYGTGYWAGIEADYRRHFEDEFTTADGRVLAIRSTHTGLTIASLTSAMADCVTAHYLHGVLPDIARRCWEIARMDFIRCDDAGVAITTRGWDNMDTGSYKPSMITTYTQVGAAAAEMGDREVAERLKERVRHEFRFVTEDGVTRVENISSQAHAVLLDHFIHRPGARHDLHRRGVPAAQQAGPLLDEVPYPDVMVAKAVNDGAALHLVLRPGCPQALGSTVTLSFSQLRPDGRYRVETGEELRADGAGRASLRLTLGERNAIDLLPVH